MFTDHENFFKTKHSKKVTECSTFFFTDMEEGNIIRAMERFGNAVVVKTLFDGMYYCIEDSYTQDPDNGCASYWFNKVTGNYNVDKEGYGGELLSDYIEDRMYRTYDVENNNIDCVNCIGCTNSHGLVDCVDCDNCFNCTGCVGCKGCIVCNYSHECNSCHSVDYGYSCIEVSYSCNIINSKRCCNIHSKDHSKGIPIDGCDGCNGQPDEEEKEFVYTSCSENPRCKGFSKNSTV